MASIQRKSDQICSQVIGMIEGKTKRYIEQERFIPRVVVRDNERFVVTSDYKMHRVNLIIRNEEIVQAKIG